MRFIKVGMALTLMVSLSGCLIELLMSTAMTADMAAQQASTVTESMNQMELDTDLMNLQDALDYYYVDKNEYPRTLTALAPAYIDTIPTRPDGEPFGYNPIDGTIYPNNNGPSTEDFFVMEDIKVAINNFGTATGYYPPKLDDLYPTYMPRLPRTSTGEKFGYSNQDGKLSHPRDGLQYADVNAEPEDTVRPVKPVNAIGSLNDGDIKDSNSLNKSLDRMGY